MTDQKAGMSEKQYLSVTYKQWSSVKDLTQKKFPCAKNVHKLMLLLFGKRLFMRLRRVHVFVY